MSVRISRRGAAAIAAALLLLLVPAVLLAHQYLRDSAPADGDVLEAVPADIRLTFYEPVRLDFTEIAVDGPEAPLSLGALRASSTDDRVLVVPVEDGWHAGLFTLRWSTVGADGHRTDGSFGFEVEEEADGLPEPEPDPVAPADEEADAVPAVHHDPRVFPEASGFSVESPGYVAVRGLLFVSLVALLGAVALRLLVLPVLARRREDEAAALRPGIDRGAARLGLVAAVALLIAALGRLWAQSASLFGTAEALDAGRLASTLSLQPWATGWWLQVIAAAVAIVGFALVGRVARAGWTLAAVGALLAAVTPALSGHAVATPGRVWLAVPADALHVLAAGGWVGGLLAVLVVGTPVAMRLGPDRRGGAFAALVHAFSPTALLFAGILVVTGVIAAWLHLGAASALWTTGYGRTLLLKLGLFAGVLAVGAYNFRRVRPALADAGPGELRRSATVELALALAVLLVTAALVAIPPPAN